MKGTTKQAAANISTALGFALITVSSVVGLIPGALESITTFIAAHPSVLPLGLSIAGTLVFFIGMAVRDPGFRPPNFRRFEEAKSASVETKTCLGNVMTDEEIREVERHLDVIMHHFEKIVMNDDD